MGNRRKITALALMSLVSISMFAGKTAEATVKLETSDGVINDITLYAKGTYVFDGYKNDDQDSSVYHFNGYEDVEIEDVLGIGEKYGMNYLNFKDDDVLFNLLTGEKEEETLEDRLDRMERKFKSVIRKVDRYDNTKKIVIGDKIAENTFGPVWYEAKVQNENGDESYTVYLSDSGEYLDVSETLNITHYNKTTGEKVKLSTFDDLEDNNYEISYEKTLFMDSKYMYRMLVIKNADNSSDQELYIQRIETKAGDKTKDGAKLPNSVKSYAQGDLDVMSLLGELHGNKDITVRVKENSVYIIKPNKSIGKITVEKYDLKKVKENIQLADGSKIKADINKLELDSDFDVVKNESMQDSSVDMLGNLWILNKGKVQKLVDDKLETMFTTDRTMNRLEVFDDNNVAVWNTEDEIYSIYNGNGQASDTETEEEKVEDVVTTGWIKNTDNTWSFVNTDGTKKTGWYNDNGTWYMLNQDGIMVTGWFNDNGTWYYLSESGAMKTGWFKDTDGRWYYLNESGAMLRNTTVDGYKLGDDGAWIR